MSEYPDPTDLEPDPLVVAARSAIRELRAAQPCCALPARRQLLEDAAVGLERAMETTKSAPAWP